MRFFRKVWVNPITKWRHSHQLFRSRINPNLACTPDDPQWDPSEFVWPIRLSFRERIEFLLKSQPVRKVAE